MRACVRACMRVRVCVCACVCVLRGACSCPVGGTGGQQPRHTPETLKYLENAMHGSLDMVQKYARHGDCDVGAAEAGRSRARRCGYTHMHPPARPPARPPAAARCPE